MTHGQQKQNWHFASMASLASDSSLAAVSSKESLVSGAETAKDLETLFSLTPVTTTQAGAGIRSLQTQNRAVLLR